MRLCSVRAVGLLILLSFAVTAAACGNNGSAEPTATATATLPTVTSPSPTANAQVCSDVAKLRSDLDDLKNINVIQSGTDAVKAKLTDIQNDLNAIKASAGSAPDAVAFQTALQGLQTAVANLGNGSPSASGLTQVATAAAGAVVAGTTVLNRLQAGCPS